MKNFIGKTIGIYYGIQVADEIMFEIYMERKEYLKAFLLNPIRFFTYKLESVKENDR